jgi:hypothetical protein
MTPSGIEPATFRFVAQHLNHCTTAVPFYLPGTLHIWRAFPYPPPGEAPDGRPITPHGHELRICNTCCFSTVTMVKRTRLFVMIIPTLLVIFKRVFLRGMTDSNVSHPCMSVTKFTSHRKGGNIEPQMLITNTKFSAEKNDCGTHKVKGIILSCIFSLVPVL